MSTENDNLTYISNCFTSYNEQGVSTPMISELLLSLQILLKKESGREIEYKGEREREISQDREQLTKGASECFTFARRKPSKRIEPAYKHTQN